MIRDLRFALRQLVKTPGFTAIAVLTLAIAIGVNSAVFALINGVFLRPVVAARPAEVVNVFTAWQNAPGDYRPFSHQEYRLLRDSDDVFTDVAALQYALVGIGEGQAIRRSLAFVTSESFFTVTGAQPAMGRFYTSAESRPNANVRVAVASHGYWKRMGGRADFVGSSLRINGQSYTVIGVTAAGFAGMHALIAPEVWLPLGVYSQLRSAFSDNPAMRDLATPTNHALNLVARLRPGLTLEGAQGALAMVARRLTDLPASPEPGRARALQVQKPTRFGLSTVPSDEGPVGLIGVLLMAMASVVLVIASLNLANMLLARGTARSKEIAVRLALGASRPRIVRQLLCEGLLLALLGGAAGLLISVWSNDLLVHSLGTLFTSMSFSLVLDINPDARVLAVTFAVCLVATLLFSLGPALRASRADLVQDLKQQAGDPAREGRLHRFFAARHLLVMAQVALSLVLLFSAGLFFRGALKAGQMSLGFQPAGAIVTELDFALGKDDRAAAARSMFAALARARELPGVRAAALGTLMPYGNITNSRRIMPAGATTDKTDPDRGVRGLYSAVSAGYFQAAGIHLLRGRDFTTAEVEGKDASPVAILDETMAALLFPGTEALGKRIRYTQPRTDGSSGEMEVVGIVNAHRHEVFTVGRVGWLFVPLGREGKSSGANDDAGNVFLFVRMATTDRDAVLGAVPTFRRALLEGAPDLPVLTIAPFVDLVEKNAGLWIVRLGAVLFGAFGAIALVLAAVGVYAVKSYAVARRTHEIGIRMALGAHPRDVFSLIMRQGALQTALALTVGLLLALAAGRVLAGILYQVSPADPVALAVASVVLAAAALLACYLPARRATRVSAMSALRSD